MNNFQVIDEHSDSQCGPDALCHDCISTAAAHIMVEYFTTGHVFGEHSAIFKLENFAAEYAHYATTGHIPEGFGKHRDHSFDGPSA